MAGRDGVFTVEKYQSFLYAREAKNWRENAIAKVDDAAVESVDAATAYQAWQAMRVSGVNRGTLPEELRLQQATTAAGRIAAVLWTVAAIGAIAAAAGGLGWLVARSRSAAGMPSGKAAR